MCFPDKVKPESYQKFMGELDDSEMCHICIIILETKKLIELTYITRALARFMA